MPGRSLPRPQPEPMVIKGENRDTAWFAMLDHEWPALETGYRRWLDPSDCDPAGRQYRTLAACLR